MANVKRANALGITKAGAGISDVPDAPTIGTATGGSSSAVVTFTAATTGGTATSFTATSSPGSITGTASSSPITVSGLTNGTAYTFTVTATNSTGTSPASSASNSVTPIVLGDMDAIAVVEVGSAGAATISFTSIPATYKHLQIRGIARSTATGSSYLNATMSFNSDTTANYAAHDLYSDGASAVAGGGGSRIPSNIGIITFPDGSIGAGTYGSGIIDILDYASTTKNKTSRIFTGADGNGSGYILLRSQLWMNNTDAIHTITLTAAFAQYSTFALYGIKG
jgi:hypothetical protein